MRIRRWKNVLLLAPIALAALAAQPALAAFDAELKVDEQTTKSMGVEKPTPARDFVQNAAVYIRILPKKGNRVFPVFINTKNYLTCPDTEQRWLVNDVKQVSYDRRSGVKVLGFFFNRPTCDNPTFHMSGVVADS